MRRIVGILAVVAVLAVAALAVADAYPSLYGGGGIPQYDSTSGGNKTLLVNASGTSLVSGSTVPVSGTVTVTDGAGALNVIVDSGTLAQLPTALAAGGGLKIEGVASVSREPVGRDGEWRSLRARAPPVRAIGTSGSLDRIGDAAVCHARSLPHHHAAAQRVTIRDHT